VVVILIWWGESLFRGENSSSTSSFIFHWLNLNLKKQKILRMTSLTRPPTRAFHWRPFTAWHLKYVDHGTSIATTIKMLMSWVKVSTFEENWIGSGGTISHSRANLKRTWWLCTHGIALWQCPHYYEIGYMSSVTTGAPKNMHAGGICRRCTYFMGRRWCSNTASTANDLCAGNKGMPDLGQPKDWSLASAVGVKILPPAHNHGIKENDRSFKK
jgi:hypothetical protein